MRLSKIKNNIYAGILALKNANSERKLVKQIDTGIRRLHNMTEIHQDLYLKSATENGHYSKNPIKRFISFIKSWNSNRKKNSFSKIKRRFLK